MSQSLELSEQGLYCPMIYSCLEELQVDLDLHALDKTNVLSKIGCQCNKGWFVVTDDGICHLFDKDGHLDDIKKIKQLKEKHIRKDITKIIIPDNVTSIENWAFFNCRGLTSVTMPDSVMSIGYHVFGWCNKLINMTFKGKTLEQVKKMKYYPWGIKDKSIISVE